MKKFCMYKMFDLYQLTGWAWAHDVMICIMNTYEDEELQ